MCHRLYLVDKVREGTTLLRALQIRLVLFERQNFIRKMIYDLKKNPQGCGQKNSGNWLETQFFWRQGASINLPTKKRGVEEKLFYLMVVQPTKTVTETS